MAKHKTEAKADNSAPEQMYLRRPSRFGAYGWQRDLPDQRDFAYAAPLVRFTGGLPAKVDLRAHCPAVYNQGQLGSCTANGIGAAMEFDRIKQKLSDFVPSRLFIYYNERAVEGHVNEDSGAQIRDGVKSVAKLGAPPETLWPYDIANFATKPPPAVYTAAKSDRVTMYARVSQDLLQMKGCLAEGFPFVFGFTVYGSFESDAVAQTGVVSMPSPDEHAVGGHAVLAVGYDEAARTFLIRNSWGADWGMAGYFTMPYEYLQNPGLASDFWTLRAIAA